MPGPIPRILLAMALHQAREVAEARKTLAAAVLAHDWRAARVRDTDGWVCHVLRREAEQMILPELPAFPEGRHLPRGNDERLALLGVCQFLDRPGTTARLFADAFAAAPELVEEFGAWHRYNAACSAALAGCDRAGAACLADPEPARWRAQARVWLRADLAAWGKALDADPAAARGVVRQRMTHWRTDPDLAGLREPAGLDKLPADERTDCVALWNEVVGWLKRAAGGR